MGARLKKLVAEKEGVKTRDVMLFMVAHHFNNVWFGEEAPGPRPPYFVKICVGDKDITDKYDTYELLKSSAASRMGMTREIGNVQVASSQCKHALALLNDTKILTLAPSPGGMIGGYPVRLGADGAKLTLPDEITEEEALKLCIEGQKRDGIEEIRTDGTIVFTDAVYEGMKKVYKFDCKSFNIKDVDAVAVEQLSKIKEVLMKYKKELPYAIY
jgi:hypothetical protein